MKHQRKKLLLSLEQGLKAYAFAASAAGVGVLALAQPAEAKIVYIKAHSVIGPNGDLWFNMVNGQTDLIFDAAWSVTTGAYGGHVWVNPRSSGNFLGHSDSKGFWNAVALPAGYSVGGHDNANHFNVSNLSGFMAGFECGSVSKKCSSGGDWFDVKNRYLGVEFRINGKLHFGWARLNLSCNRRSGCTALLTGFAHETIANKPIITGKTKGPDVITIQPGSLGHLSHGASAIPAWRWKD
jgi:hypothetical protein